MNHRGYYGEVTLVSPCGNERVIVVLASRQKVFVPNGGGRTDWVSHAMWPNHKHDGLAKAKRADKRFYRYLSAGWRVLAELKHEAGQQKTEDEESEEAEEAKKNTDVVIGTTQTGDKSHGGKHASCEVKESPNHAKRGNRGGRGKKEKHERKERNQQKSPNATIQVQNAKQTGNVGVYSPQPLRFSYKLVASAEKSAELLRELVGRSQQKTHSGTTVDVQGLLIALEVGDNPLPYLETPRPRPRIRVLLTPDCSGSCQGWSGLASAWALHLSKQSNVDVFVVQNVNGEFWGVDSKDVETLLAKFDVVVYLGDGDGYDLCKNYAQKGATVVAFDNYCCNVAKARLSEDLSFGSGGRLFRIDRVNVHSPDTWYDGLRLALAA